MRLFIAVVVLCIVSTGGVWAVKPKSTPCGCLSQPKCECRPGFRAFHPDPKTWPDMNQPNPNGAFVDGKCGCAVCPCQGEVVTAVQQPHGDCKCLLQPVCPCRAGEAQTNGTPAPTTGTPAPTGTTAPRFQQVRDTCGCQAQGPSCPCYVKPEIKEPVPCGQPSCATTTTTTVTATPSAPAPCGCVGQPTCGCAPAAPAPLKDPVPAKVEAPPCGCIKEPVCGCRK